MVNNPLLADVKFLINNETVYAHKSLLMYWWADERLEENGLFFEWIVNYKSHIDFSIPIQKSTFLSLLEFIYCGTFINLLTAEEVK